MMPAVAAAGALLAIENAARATNGTWTFTAANAASWSTTTNWFSGTVANGTSGIADFSKLNITQDMTVNLDSPRTIGQLLFADTTQSNQWTLDNNGNAANILTLDNGASKPVLTIGGTANAVTGQLTTISATIAGTNGFIKTGSGALVLTGSNTFTGQVTVNSTYNQTGAPGVGANISDLILGSNNALGAATNTLFIDPDPNAQNNVTRVRLNADVVISNPITIHGARAPQRNGVLQTNGDAVSATLSGPITIDGVVTSGGDFSGPNDSSLNNFLKITGPITLSNLYTSVPANMTNSNNNGVVVRTGNVMLSGGGNYFRIEQRNGELRLGANNGIATNAYLEMGVNNGNPGGGVNATFDLFGFNQTLVGLENIDGLPTPQPGIVTNTGNAPSILTLTPGIAANQPTPPNLIFQISNMTDGQSSNPNSLLNVVINGAPTAIQTFNNTASTYHGSTTLMSSILAVNTLADGGSPSSIGASPADASNLVFSGGTLRYTGGSTSTNRNFTTSTGSSAVFDVSNGASTLTLNGAGTGGGGLTKAGAGTLVLSGNQTYTGNTTISGGALVVNGNLPASSNVSIAGAATLAGTGTIGGAVTTSAGAIIVPAGAGSTGTLTVGALTLSTGAQVNLEFGGNNDEVAVSNSSGLTVNGGNLFLFMTGSNTAFASNGTYTLFNINGGFGGSGANPLDNLTISNPVAGKFYNITSSASAISLTIGDATTIQWTNGNNNDLWTSSASWSGGVIPNAVGQTASFGSLATGSGSVNMNGNKTVSGLIFNNNAVSSFDIFGSGNLTIDNGSAAGAITVLGGNHVIDVPIVLNGAVSVMTTNGGDSLNMNGNISGAFPLNVSGPGAVTLSGTNTFSTMSISASTLNVGNGGVGGTLGTGSVTLSNNAVLNFNSSSNYNFGQAITGVGTLSQMGSGTTTVGAVNVTGVDVPGGALVTSSIAQTSGINVRNSGRLTANGTVSGAGSLVVNTSGAVSLAASNTYTGETEIDAGTLTLNAVGALPANSVLAVNGGTLDLNGKAISISNILDQSSSSGVITNNAAASTATVSFNGNTNSYDMYAALNDGATGGKVALVSAIQNVNGGSFSLILHASSSYSGGTTIARQSVDAYTSNAFGTGSILIQTTPTGVNATHVGLAGGVSLPNDIVVQQPNGGAGTLSTLFSAITYLPNGPTGGNATLNGAITVQANPVTGGLFGGPAGGDFLFVNGPVNTTGTATSISVWAGRVAFSGGGNYPQLDIFGTTVGAFPGIAFVGVNNGINTAAVVNLVAGTLDLNGNNQTLSGLIGAAGGATNGSGTFSTLTLHVTTDRSTGGSINGNLNLVKNGPATQTITAAAGPSTYQGNTIVQNGALAMVGSGAWGPVTNNGNGSAFTDIQGGRVVFDWNNDSDPTSQVNTLLANSFTPTGSFNNTTGAIRSSTGTGTLGLGIYDDMNLKLTTVAYTVFGDANLDGRANALDFNALATNFGTGNIWYQGDFNYDGIVNTADFNKLAQDFLMVAPTPTASLVLGTLVPEPGAVGFLLSATGLIFIRRRRAALSS